MDVDTMRDNWLMSGVDADARAHMTDQEVYELELTDVERRDIDYLIIDLQNKDILNEGFNLLDNDDLDRALAHLMKNHDKYLHKALVAEGYAK